MSLKLPDVGSNVNRIISKTMYYASKTYAAHYGPGGEAPDIPHMKKVTIKAEDIDLCMEHIMDVNNVQKLACGTKPLVLSNGTTLVVPEISR